MSHPRKQVERPYCGSRWTRARFFAFIRSALRLASRKWPPRIDAKAAARRKIQANGRKSRQKFEYQCSICQKWFKGADTEVDHVIPCGRLSDYEDIPGFIERLFCEAENLRVVCKGCHGHVTKRGKRDGH